MAEKKEDPTHYLIHWSGWIITLTILSITGHCMVDSYLSSQQATANTCEAQAGLVTINCMHGYGHDERINCMMQGAQLLRLCNVEDPKTTEE